MTTNVTVHILRSLPPNSVNRDREGVPKTADFGGVTRGRYSSQSTKYALRFFLEEKGLPISMRSREVSQILVQPLVDKGHSFEDAWTITAAFLTLHFTKVDVKDERQVSSALIALSNDEIADIIQSLHENFETALQAISKDDKGDLVVEKNSVLHQTSKKLTKQYADWSSAVDIALSGRMVASNADLEIRAAMQLSHAITTGVSSPQLDFWIGADRMAKPAAMIGDAYFLTGCYYQMFNLDWQLLNDNLAGDVDLARSSVREVLRGIALSIPGGKRNTYFAASVPGLMLVELRTTGHPYLYANAFDTPVSARDGGQMRLSAEALADYYPFAAAYAGYPDYIGVLPGAPEVKAALEKTPLHPDKFTGTGALAWHTDLESLINNVLERL